MNLFVAFCAVICMPSTLVENPVATRLTSKTVAEIPLTAPKGWKTDKQEGVTLLTPGDVAEGKLYTVMITMTEGKAGSLDALIEDGKKMAAAVGPFKAAIDPKQSKSDGGWDYKFVLGGIEKSGRTLVAQIMAIKKSDDGGVVIVLSDSVETMTHYADAFGSMVRAMGAKPAPPKSDTVDLQYTLPEGWVAQKINGYPLLVKEKNEVWTKFRMSLLIFPSEPLSGSVRDQFEGYWKAFVTPNYTTNIAPLPLMTRLKSGHALAFDADSQAKDKNGNQVTVAIYMIAHGGRVVPVMGIYSGTDWLFDKTAEQEIERFLDTSRIPGTSSEQVPLFSAASLAGNWSESGTEHATYVTRDGGYAGNATISTASYFNLNSNGTYERTLMAVSDKGNIREKDSGAWTVNDDELVLANGVRYTLLGYGADPKVGRFLVLSNYSNQRSRLKLTNPRGILQALWLKAK